MGCFESVEEKRRYDSKIKIIDDMIYIRYLETSLSTEPHPKDVYVWVCFKLVNLNTLSRELSIFLHYNQNKLEWRSAIMTDEYGGVRRYTGPHYPRQNLVDSIIPRAKSGLFKGKPGRNFIFFHKERVEWLRFYIRDAVRKYDTEIDNKLIEIKKGKEKIKPVEDDEDSSLKED